MSSNSPTLAANVIDTETSSGGGSEPSSHGLLFGVLDFQAMWAAVYRSRFLIAWIMAGALALGVAATLLMTPKYRAVATVQIDQEAAKVIGTEETALSASISDSDRFLQTQLDIIESRALAIAVAEDLAFFDGSEFLERMGENPEPTSNIILDPEEAAREKVLSVIEDNLSVTLPLRSRVLSIAFTSPDPVLAQQVANGYADNYIRKNLQRKFDTSTYAREFLRTQLDEAVAKLAESEQEALNYARTTRIVDTSNAATGRGAGGNPSSLLAANLVQLNASYSVAVDQRIRAEKEWQQVRNAPLLNVPQVLENTAIQRLLEEKAKVEAIYSEQLQARKEQFPTVKRLQAQIAELDGQINAIANGIRNGVRTAYQTALERERALDRQISELKSQALEEQSKSVNLGILQRQAATDRELYDLLLQRYSEVNAEAGVQTNNVSLLDEAPTPDEPFSPEPALNMILALMGGIIAAAGTVFLREQIFDRVRSVADVSNKLGRSTLGAIPVFKGDEDRLVTELNDNKTVLAEAYASVRASLLLSTSHGLPDSVMFTSAIKGEGKSTSCFATALALSRIGKRVLLVDLDLRRPQQHRFFSDSNDHGMSDLLTENATIEEVVRVTEFDNISVIPSGPIPPNPTEVLASGSLGPILKQLEARYDVILVDAPPVLALADAVEVAKIAEGCVFVVEAGKTQTSALKGAIARLEKGANSVLGILLTKFDAKESGSAFDYTYQYEYEA